MIPKIYPEKSITVNQATTMISYHFTKFQGA